MSELIEKIDYKGCVIKIYPEEDIQSPDEFEDDGIFTIGWNDRNFYVKRDGFEKGHFGYLFVDKDNYSEYKERALEIKKDYFVFGLDAYIHSGICLSMHNEGLRDRFDTSDYIGAIFVKKTEARTKEKAEKLARDHMKYWNDCLNGNVYRFITEDEENGIDIDSCGGFAGDIKDSGIINEAKGSIDWYLKNDQEKAIKNKKSEEIAGKTLGELICDMDESIKRNAIGILKQLQKRANA